MIFDIDNKVIVETLNKAEALAFVKFLDSECKRHERDIQEARQLMREVVGKFEL